jgi:4-methyl-5(b-hydroxyethyl)-thiazole monophosphate biosynthesis
MVYLFLAEGFEEIEALCPIDIIRRAGIKITTVGIGSRTVVGAHGIAVVSDITDSEYVGNDAEMIILPGGMPGTLNLGKSDVCVTAIKDAVKNNVYVAAICAAPSILGNLGFLHNKNAVCYPGFEDMLLGANVLSDGVCQDGKIITAAGMGLAVEFSLKLVEALKGKDASERIYESIQAHRR